MYGYIKPMQGELKVREYERFKASYCGLCHALGKKYGLIARFVLNYELVFLTMLLWADDQKPIIKRKRCIASPFTKKRYCISSMSQDLCAGYSIILTWWKLHDSISDESFLKSLPHRFAKLLLRRAYHKAAAELPEFNSNVKKLLSELFSYEARTKEKQVSKNEVSLDEAADKFANILKFMADDIKPETKQRVLYEFLYHLGRWIYIIDACDDLKDDIKNKRYNPIALKYLCDLDGNLLPDSKEALRLTITHSNNLLAAAFELLPENTWSGILGNMIYQGMPDACERVLDGKPLTRCPNNS